MAIHYQKTMTFHLEGLKYLKVLSLSKTWNYTEGTSPFRVPVFSSTGFNNWPLELHCGRHLLQNIHEDSFYPSGQAGDTSQIQTILWFMQFNIIRKQQSPVSAPPFSHFLSYFHFWTTFEGPSKQICEQQDALSPALAARNASILPEGRGN